MQLHKKFGLSIQRNRESRFHQINFSLGQRFIFQLNWYTQKKNFLSFVCISYIYSLATSASMRIWPRILSQFLCICCRYSIMRKKKITEKSNECDLDPYYWDINVFKSMMWNCILRMDYSINWKFHKEFIQVRYPIKWRACGTLESLTFISLELPPSFFRGFSILQVSSKSTLRAIYRVYKRNGDPSTTCDFFSTKRGMYEKTLVSSEKRREDF